MKRQYLNNLARKLTTTALMLLLPVCAALANNMADTEMERALVNAGFKVRPATSHNQRHGLRGMPDTQFEVVQQKGETYYLYADKRDNRLYVGDHWAYQAYQGFLKNRRLRKDGAFVWEVRPSDKANNKTVEVWNGYPPFRSW